MRKISAGLIRDVELALGSSAHVPTDGDPPFWLDGEGPWPAREVVPFPNMLLHLPGFAAGRPGCTIEPTPRFFSTRRMGFAFDRDAGEPKLWLEFLGQILGRDPQAVELLQDWFGYCLTGDTSQQKILMIVGPTRSGKGTIGRLLAGLLGAESVAGPGFSTLATNFGGESLIHKTLAVVGDARLSGRSDQAVVLERLLSISGEDRITVDRKHRPAWVGTLPTRLMLLSNEVPELRDASLALANRLLILKLDRSFLGQEDPELTNRLLAELPGIFRWAVAGWTRLQERKAFASPASGLDIMRTMKDLSSPVSAFVEECCVLSPASTVPSAGLFQAYRAWCQRKGQRPPYDSRFGRDLSTAFSDVQHGRANAAGEGQGRVGHYLGIALRPEAAQQLRLDGE